MSRIQKGIRSLAHNNTRIVGRVIDVTADGKASISLSRTGAIYKGISVVGGPVSKNQIVAVDFTTSPPTITAPGQLYVPPEIPKTKVEKPLRKTKVQSYSNEFGISFIVPTSGSPGLGGYIEVPFNCELNCVTLVSDVSATCSLDIYKDTYANFPPTSADSIVASAPPALSAEIKYKDAELQGWTKTLAKGDWLAIYVDSVDVEALLTISLLGVIT